MSGTAIGDNLRFDSGTGELTASRFILQSGHVADTAEDARLLRAVRAVVASSDLNATVFHPAFPAFDQYASVQADTASGSAACVATMAAVSYLLLFNAPAVACICATIFSVYLGVLGSMSYLGINVDVISMICLMISTGFSVDYSAHVVNHYMFCGGRNAEERIM